MRDKRQLDATGKLRPGYLRQNDTSIPANDGAVYREDALCIIPMPALLAAVREAVQGVMGDRAPGKGERVYDREEIALALSCSAGKVDRMRRAGMPCIYIGDSPRFRFEDVIDWLAAQRKEGT